MRKVLLKNRSINPQNTAVHCQQYSISLERCGFSHSNAVSKIHAILLLMYIESQGCFRGAPMLVRFVQDQYEIK